MPRRQRAVRPLSGHRRPYQDTAGTARPYRDTADPLTSEWVEHRLVRGRAGWQPLCRRHNPNLDDLNNLFAPKLPPAWGARSRAGEPCVSRGSWLVRRPGKPLTPFKVREVREVGVVPVPQRLVLPRPLGTRLARSGPQPSLTPIPRLARRASPGRAGRRRAGFPEPIKSPTPPGAGPGRAVARPIDAKRRNGRPTHQRPPGDRLAPLRNCNTHLVGPHRSRS